MRKLITMLAIATAFATPAAHATGALAATSDKTGAGLELTNAHCPDDPAADHWITRGFNGKGETFYGGYTKPLPGSISVRVHWNHGADRTYPLARFDVTDYGERVLGPPRN
ncbi:hypothetical protein LMG24238_07642 [Paraburkholderia sediminicola]|uniref:Uncharacterized protein n=1 Tax=Paraburkholderia sediminicola TaxID=458836 RepID=A0A6J5CWJ1_9BURK|nr:hypothetical protein [Paraburkholderia sediminicola]CAB3745510.1 hypothetical protein LMG24238_07642 [Paraburkholderia sediminicola]